MPQTESHVVAGIMEQNALQIEQLKDVMLRAEERRIDTDTKLSSLAEAVSIMTRQMAEGGGGAIAARSTGEAASMDRLSVTQERLVQVMQERAEDGSGMDAESRMRLRNIDVQLLRILEEMAAGRQDSVAEIRAELSALTEAVRKASGQE